MPVSSFAERVRVLGGPVWVNGEVSRLLVGGVEHASLGRVLLRTRAGATEVGPLGRGGARSRVGGGGTIFQSPPRVLG